MERRSFIRGLLVSATAATSSALVKLAKPEEIKALVENRDVVLAQPERQHIPDFEGISSEVYIRKTFKGVEKYVPIGIITRINIKSSVEEMVSWDGTATLVPGLRRGELEFEGLRIFDGLNDRYGH